VAEPLKQMLSGDELVGILLDAWQRVSTAKGCKVYVAGKGANDPNSGSVTEIWETKEDHDNDIQPCSFS